MSSLSGCVDYGGRPYQQSYASPYGMPGSMPGMAYGGGYSVMPRPMPSMAYAGGYSAMQRPMMQQGMEARSYGGYREHERESRGREEREHGFGRR
ncbi:MAG: hypothetical protein ABSB19_02750 [Methylomonas sp.]